MERQLDLWAEDMRQNSLSIALGGVLPMGSPGPNPLPPISKTRVPRCRDREIPFLRGIL